MAFHMPAGTAGVLTLLAGLAASGCVRNPATGQNQAMLVSESQAIQMGQQYDRVVVASIGLYPDSAHPPGCGRAGHAELPAADRSGGAEPAAAPSGHREARSPYHDRGAHPAAVLSGARGDARSDQSGRAPVTARGGSAHQVGSRSAAPLQRFGVHPRASLQLPSLIQNGGSQP